MPKYWNHFKPLNASNKYHPQTALSLAIACDLAYEEKVTRIREIAKGWGYSTNNIRYLKKTFGLDIDSSCVILANDDDIIVAFTGSESANDWLTNFQTSYDAGPMKGCKAHEGFQDALYPLVIKLTDTIQELRKKGPDRQRVWLTGHSLGGALCLLYAGMRLENKLEFHGIYTFGAPRPANVAFAEALEKRVSGPLHRVVNQGDVVPHVPPEPFYHHPGTRMILVDNKKPSGADGTWLSERVSMFKYFMGRAGQLLSIADIHRLSADKKKSYIPKLIAGLP